LQVVPSKPPVVIVWICAVGYAFYVDHRQTAKMCYYILRWWFLRRC